MASFPILTSLKVCNYGLYPGDEGTGTTNLVFAPGLTLILGANGLGKTTLIMLLFRMLTGPFDLGLPSGSIGTAELKATGLGTQHRRAFAARVNDGAIHATATLVFELGTKRFTLTRSIYDLSLKTFSIDGGNGLADEQAFQKHVITTAKVTTFGEWILVLRTMVFFFEDRRALVWDASAQRQLLRCLLLSPEQATKWANAERDILQLDTRMRNLQAALRREQRDTQETERRTQQAPGVRAALHAAEATQERLRERQDVLADTVEVRDQTRHRERLDSLRSQAEHDAAIQELERARLSAVESRFPSADASTRYIFSRLMADDQCLVCGTVGRVKKRDELLAAVDRGHCVLCDSPLKVGTDEAIDLGDERIAALRRRVDLTSGAVAASRKLLSDATQEYDRTSNELAKCATELADIRDRISTLVSQLPPEEQAARRQHDELKELEQRVNMLRDSIKEKREAFSTEMNDYREAIRRFADAIKHAFEQAARGFLLEDSRLSWSPLRAQVGQAGAEGMEPIEYPAFAVELAGADFGSIVRRDGPDQVSESQREFIDLAFRMALIHVAADSQAGMIVIDAPESSLDAVFVDRAANVLARFANANGTNRLIVTSNLAASDLIPALLIAAEKDPAKRAGRVFDLFKKGVPTRAMRELAQEYDRLRGQLYKDLAATTQGAPA